MGCTLVLNVYSLSTDSVAKAGGSHLLSPHADKLSVKNNALDENILTVFTII